MDGVSQVGFLPACMNIYPCQPVLRVDRNNNISTITIMQVIRLKNKFIMTISSSYSYPINKLLIIVVIKLKAISITNMN
jgi:hypothetical protein